MRYLTEYIKKDLEKKMVMLSGPRQTGKTTLAKDLISEQGFYLNWDIKEDQKIIRNIAWPKDVSIVVLDEIHKYKKWKSFLKGICDGFKNKPAILVTGSARLETFRKSGDAMTGRYFHYRLHPIDLSESKLFLNLPIKHRLEHLLKTGGFPEAVLNPSNAERLRNDRFDLVVEEDLFDLTQRSSVRGLQLLIELLRERVGSQISYANLSQDLSVSPPTVKNWIEILERLYIVFRVMPFYKNLSRSIRKEPKLYFYDCAAAYENETKGARLENAVACSLLKYCHFMRDIKGLNFDLCYFRDRDNHEVDFVMTLNRKVHWLIEIKTSDDSLNSNLKYLYERTNSEGAFQLVLNLGREKEYSGIKVLELCNWLDTLFT